MTTRFHGGASTLVLLLASGTVVAAVAVASGVPASVRAGVREDDSSASGSAIRPSLAALKGAIEPASLAAFHELLGSEPHIAGTPGDARQIERLADAFTKMDLATRIEPFWAMLPAPIEARLEIIEAGTVENERRGLDGEDGASYDGPRGTTRGDSPRVRRGVVALPLRESNLLEDPATAHPDLTWGWNAYSGSGDVTAGVVFAHRGSREDFARLRERGIDVAGKIALIRYGGIFRGQKVRNAQDAGAAGVLLYTDPADSGAIKGAVWPDGGWANDLCIQRGSVVTLEQPGDPLTPFVPATRDAPRRDAATLDLPRIPVQPIGYAAAAQIISRMRGEQIAKEDPWHGGIAAPYRFDGGPELQLRLVVKQDREVRESANVIAVLPGSRWPEEAVIIGCHHDAWGFGAADPLAGTIVLMETARVFAERARAGERPLRTIIFAAWGAEEFGIIGSVEWVEAHREAIARQAVAYINLDMASMGLSLHASAVPSLRALVQRATGIERVGDPGGGSDHVGFLHHLAIPAIGLGAHGAAGDSYHSNYDTIEWYRRTVGDDYASAALVTGATVALTDELAASPLLPLRTKAIGTAIIEWTTALRSTTSNAQAVAALDAIAMRGESIADLGARIDARLDALARRAWHPDDSDGAASRLEMTNRNLMALDRAWFDSKGLFGRPWWRNLALASDRESGYGALPLPLLAEAMEVGDDSAIADAMERTAEAIDRIATTLQEIDASMAGLNE